MTTIRPLIPAAALAGVALLAALGASPAAAQKLHTNHHWKECSIVLHPALTQDAFHQFVAEVGVVTYFRPLASARPLGRGKIDVSLLQWSTRIDDEDAAWNDTFSHPDSTHYLIEGDALPIPGAMVRVGVTDRLDAGAYFTKNPNANYGFVGAHLQYNLKEHPQGKLAAATRVGAVRLFGPDDVTTSVYGLDLVVSTRLSVFEPYAMLSSSITHGDEHTSKIDLDDETVLGAQATAGVAVNISKLRLGAEVYSGRVGGYAIKIGFGT